MKVINGYAVKNLKQIREAGVRMYSDLEDMYQYTDKVEKKAVVDSTCIFKRAIEEERKIENEVQINYVQVLQTELIRNF